VGGRGGGAVFSGLAAFAFLSTCRADTRLGTTESVALAVRAGLVFVA
jgi:hypothetical protein